MKVNVIRDACCGADDQANRLDAVFEMDDGATLEALLQRICSSDFLQYSSSHNRLSAEIDGREIVQVTPSGISRWSPDVLPTESVMKAVGKNTVFFSFRFNVNI